MSFFLFAIRYSLFAIRLHSDRPRRRTHHIRNPFEAAVRLPHDHVRAGVVDRVSDVLDFRHAPGVPQRGDDLRREARVGADGAGAAHVDAGMLRGRRVIELDLMTPQQHTDMPEEEDVTAADRLIVESPTSTGVIVLKALAPEPGQMASARRTLSGARCRPQPQ